MTLAAKPCSLDLLHIAVQAASSWHAAQHSAAQRSMTLRRPPRRRRCLATAASPGHGLWQGQHARADHGAEHVLLENKEETGEG